MTTDDLRTRAREAAEERWPIPTEPHSPVEWHDVGMVSGFVLGALWHAAQQPSREQIAMLVHAKGGITEELRPEACRTCRVSLDTADAVLALFDGPVS